MPVIFKPVGNISPNKLEIHKELVGTLKLSNIEMIFEEYGLNKEDLLNTKFVANSETIKNDEKSSFTVSNTDNLIIFVFSAIKSIKEKLEQIFIKNCTLPNTEENNEQKSELKKQNMDIVDSYIQKSIDITEPEVIPVLDDLVVQIMNEKSRKLFENQDFRHLIRIYLSNQDIFKQFLQYIKHGDIIGMNIPKMKDNTNLQKDIDYFKGLGIKESDDSIKKCLEELNGNLNLALRIFLCRDVLEM